MPEPKKTDFCLTHGRIAMYYINGKAYCDRKNCGKEKRSKIGHWSGQSKSKNYEGYQKTAKQKELFDG